MENEKRHTAGPWKACNPELWQPGDRIVVYGDQDEDTNCEVCEVYPDPDDGDRDANVRLIAAAPELLAACEFALALLTSGPVDGCPELSCRRLLQDAIAKAKGGAT